jgi:hypothetical protein
MLKFKHTKHEHLFDRRKELIYFIYFKGIVITRGIYEVAEINEEKLKLVHLVQEISQTWNNNINNSQPKKLLNLNGSQDEYFWRTYQLTQASPWF